MSNSEDLPTGWVRATIEDLVSVDGVFCDGDWVESKDQDPEGDVRLIQLADVGDGSYVNKSARFLTSQKARELRCTFLEPGDVLIARMPDPLGRACLFPGDRRRSVTVVDVAVVRTGRSGADHRWLLWVVNSPDFRRSVADLQSGSTRKRISRRNLASIPLPVPPLSEQRRIADAVEAELSRLGSATSALRRVQSNLKRYRASVLKAACEGRLVPTEAELARKEGREYEPADVLLERILTERRARWEAAELAKLARAGKQSKGEARKQKYKGPASPDTIDLPGLPEGWMWTTVEQTAAFVITWITDGPFGSNLKSAHYTDAGPRVVRLQNIGDGSFIDAEAHISEAHFRDLRKHEVFAGDLVIAALGNRPPRACIIPRSLGPAIVKADCIRFKPDDDLLLPEYAQIILNAEPTKARMAEIVHGVGRPRLNLGEIKSIALPLPPLAEQERIITEVERRLSALDVLESTVERDLRRAERLRQSILKRAFEGKLVPQDPADEPAAALLERIRAERGTKNESRQPRRARQTVDAAAD